MGNSRMGRTGRGVALAAALTCLLAACGGGTTDQDDNTSPEPTSATTETSPDDSGSESTEAPPSEPPAETGTASAQGQEALLQAGETGLGAVDNSTVFTIEEESGGNRWEVKVVTPDGEEYELDTSADGATVVSGPRREREDADDRADNRRRMNEAELDFRAAVPAITEVVAGRITELDLDSERGKTAWEADVIDGDGVKHEVSIDAASGDVLSHETDD